MNRRHALKFTVVFEDNYWRIRNTETSKLIAVLYSNKTEAFRNALYLNNL